MSKAANLKRGDWGKSSSVLYDRVDIKLKEIKMFNTWTLGVGKTNLKGCVVLNLRSFLENTKLKGTTEEISMIFNSKGDAACERENNLKERCTEWIEEMSLAKMEYC